MPISDLLQEYEKPGSDRVPDTIAGFHITFSTVVVFSCLIIYLIPLVLQLL